MSISLDIDIQLTRNVNEFNREIKKSRILSKFVTSIASSFFEAMRSSLIFKKLSIASQIIIQMIIQNKNDNETKNKIENENENKIDEKKDNVEKIKNKMLMQTQS